MKLPDPVALIVPSRTGVGVGAVGLGVFVGGGVFGVKVALGPVLSLVFPKVIMPDIRNTMAMVA